MNTLYVLIIAGVLALPLFMAVAFFWRYLNNWEADRHVDRQTRATRFKADHLGNYELFYNPKTGASFAPPPGNRAFPEQIILNNGQMKPVQAEQSRPFVVQVNQPAKIVGVQDEQKAEQEVSTGVYRDVQPEQIDTEPELKELPEPEHARTFEQSVALLADLKRSRGEGSKVKSCLEVAGVKSRSSETYKIYAAIWDGLEL